MNRGFIQFCRRPFAIAGILVAVTLLVYSPARHFEFLTYDDDLYITDNPRVILGFTWENVVWAFTSLEIANWHPVTWLSHLLDYQLFGLNAGAHHLVSVGLHAVNVLLLFLLMRRMTRCLWQSCLVAALFAFHPLNVDSVAWIAERKNLLSTGFALLTIWTYVSYVHNRGWKRYCVVLACFGLAVMSKAMLVTLPCVLLLLDYWPLRRWDLRLAGALSNSDMQERRASWSAVPFRTLVLEKIPLLLLSAVSSTLTVTASRLSGDLESVGILSLPVRITNSLVAYEAYIHKALWPANLAVFYPHSGAHPPVWEILVSILAIGGISLLAWRRAQVSPYLLVGWAWFLGSLFPVIGVLQTGGQFIADRYAYWPLIGLLICVVWGTHAICGLAQRAFVITSGIVVLCLTTVTILQLRHWKNAYELFGHALSVTQGNFVAHDQFAVALLTKGQVAEAQRHFLSSIETNPKRSSFHKQCLSNTLVRLGDLLEETGASAAAKEKYLAAVEADSRNAAALNSLGIAVSREGRDTEAIGYYRQGLAVKCLPKQRAALGLNLGHALNRQGKRQEAIESYLEAIRWDPANPTAYVLVGGLFYLNRRLDDAARYLHQGLQIRPDASAYFFLGMTMSDSGKLREAVTFYRRALELRPDHSEARRRLEDALARSGQSL